MSNLPVGTRLPPQVLDLEVAVLSAILVERPAFDKVAGILVTDSFYLPKHQVIFRAMTALNRANQPIDLLMVMENLKKANELDLAGGASYLAHLTGRVTSSANIEYHARIVAEKYILRSIIQSASSMIQQAYTPEADGLELLHQTNEEFFSLLQGMSRKSVVTYDELGADRMLYYEEMRNREPGVMIGQSVGLRAVDDFTAGFRPGHLIIVAARPAMGKSAFAMQFARALGVLRGIGVGIFSLEMPDNELYDRSVTQEAALPGSKVQDPALCSDSEFARLRIANSRVRTAPIQVDDTGGIDIMELRAKARQMVAKGAKMIIIDYVQLVKANAGKNATRANELSIITRSLKEMAKELEVPVIALAQLSRAVELRGGDKRPQLSDLKESGSIEEDADIVMFLYRPEYYKIYEDEQGNSLRGVTELIWGKNRGGESGKTSRLQFIAPLGLFRDIDDLDFEVISEDPKYGANWLEENGGKPFAPGEKPGEKALPSKMNSDDDIPF